MERDTEPRGKALRVEARWDPGGGDVFIEVK